MEIIFEGLLLEAVAIALRLIVHQLMEWWQARPATGALITF